MPNSKALVIRSIKNGETSLIVSCYLEDIGYKTFIVKGVYSSKKSKLMWADKDGKLQSLQTRRYENAKTYLTDLIKNHLGESGIPKGLRVDFKTRFKINNIFIV